MVRAFVAIELDDAIIHAFDPVRVGLGQRFPMIRWVDPDRLHLTLRFLGEVEEDRLRRLGERLRSSGEIPGRFDLEVINLGCFPARGMPRVIWAGIGAGADRLLPLVAAINARVDEAGLPAEARPFRAHITTARIKGKVPAALWEAMEPFRNRIWGRMAVRQFVLMESRLAAVRPTYRVVETILLPG